MTAAGPGQQPAAPQSAPARNAQTVFSQPPLAPLAAGMIAHTLWSKPRKPAGPFAD